MDKSGANKAAVYSLNSSLLSDDSIDIRQVKYLNNLVEQDHRFIKKIIKPRMGFKYFFEAQAIIAGIELIHMLRKGQKLNSKNIPVSEQFCSLAA